jgi:hypothetical protein
MRSGINRRCYNENPILCSCLGPRIRQCPGEASDREVRRCGAIDDRRNDARRQEGKRDEQADVPFSLDLTLGNRGERANAAEPDFVDPSSSLGTAVSSASRISAFIVGFAQGTCTMLFTGAIQGSVIVVGGWQGSRRCRTGS